MDIYNASDRPYPIARAPIAQPVEHLICNQGAVGSNPAGGTTRSIVNASPYRLDTAWGGPCHAWPWEGPH